MGGGAVDATLLVAITASVVALLSLGALVVVLAAGGVMYARSQRRPRRRLEDLSGEAHDYEPDDQVETMAPGEGAGPHPNGPAPLAGGLLGFFDDEVSAADEATRTEMFQRGKLAEYWDGGEDPEEGEATEIFSAHGAASDLAEFAFDDNDESTGRFST